MPAEHPHPTPPFPVSNLHIPLVLGSPMSEPRSLTTPRPSSIISSSLLEIVSSQTAMTKYHSLDSLNNRNLFFSQFWRLEAPDHGASMVGFW